MTFKDYEKKEDVELMQLYIIGDDEVVFCWVLSKAKYFDILFIVALRRLFEINEMAEEALHEVIKDLQKVDVDKRPTVLNLTGKDQKVERDLRVRVDRRAIDLYRKYDRDTNEMSDEKLKLLLDERLSDSFIARLEARDMIDFLKKELLRKYGQEEVDMIDLILKYGTGKLKPIADDLGIDSDKARKVKYRVMRRARRILLNTDQNYGKAS